MSWKENISQPFRLITGDGKEYNPLQMESTNVYSYDFNVSEFEFPEVSGTKVDRRLPKGRRFPIDIYFQGADNIDQAEGFRLSANDTRPWIIFHPVFGRLDGHPVSIKFDSSGINTTQITIDFVESITEDGPRITQDLANTTIASAQKALDEANVVVSENVTPEISDVTYMASNTNKIYEDSSGFISDSSISAEYQNAFTKASTVINTAIGNASFDITTIQNFITYPFIFADSVQNRFIVFLKQLDTLTTSIDTLTTTNKKTIFENFKSSVLLAMVKSCVAPNGDEYQNAPDVLDVITQLISSYNQFINELNSLQSINGTILGAFIPNYTLQNELNFAVNFAVANLYQIALNAQQARIVTLEKDSNVIIQTHRFYGLDVEDVNLNRFIDTNSVSLNELIQLKKGRELVYYV